jgi:hypothetical protein
MIGKWNFTKKSTIRKYVMYTASSRQHVADLSTRPSHVSCVWGLWGVQNILEACGVRETVTWLLICNPQITMTHESLDLNKGLLPKMVIENLNHNIGRKLRHAQRPFYFKGRGRDAKVLTHVDISKLITNG